MSVNKLDGTKTLEGEDLFSLKVKSRSILVGSTLDADIFSVDTSVTVTRTELLNLFDQIGNMIFMGSDNEE